MSDLLDEITAQDLQKDHKSELVNLGIIIDPWTSSEPPEPIALAELRKLCPKGTKNIVANLYFYNSTVEIIKSTDNTFLLLLRDTQFVIDLFNDYKEDFAGNHNTDKYINMILKQVGCESFVFLSLKEAIMANKIFIRANRDITLNKGVVSYGSSMLGEELWRFTLTKLFHGKHNWACNISYFAMKEQLKDSIYRHQVMCYESCSYIREEKDFIIEVEVSNEIDSLEIVPIIIFSLNKQNPSDIQLRFHGLFELDKNRSLQDNHVTLRCIESSLKV